MELTKILSISIFALLCIAIIFIFLKITFLKKEDESISRIIVFTSILIGVGIVLNAVFNNINTSYDIINSYNYTNDFLPVLPIGNEYFGLSKSLTKLIVIELLITFVWLFIFSFISSLFVNAFFKEDKHVELVRGILFLVLLLILNPIFKYILSITIQYSYQPFYN